MYINYPIKISALTALQSAYILSQRASSERLDWLQSVSGRRLRSLNAACWPHCSYFYN